MYIVHDEEGTAKVGDYVELLPTRPISKNKRFKLGCVHGPAWAHLGLPALLHCPCALFALKVYRQIHRHCVGPSQGGPPRGHLSHLRCQLSPSACS